MRAISSLSWAYSQEKNLRGNDLRVAYTDDIQANFRQNVDKLFLEMTHFPSLLYAVI